MIGSRGASPLFKKKEKKRKKALVEVLLISHWLNSVHWPSLTEGELEEDCS